MSFCLPWLARPIQMQQLICLGQPALSTTAEILGCQVMGCNPGCPNSGAGREHHIAADGAAAWGCLSRESGVALLLLLSLP